MEGILYTELNLFALVILLLIFINVHHQSDAYFNEQKLFLALIFCNALLLITDTFMWILDGTNGQLVFLSLSVITTIYYILNPIVCFIWALYADYQTNRDKKRVIRIFIYLLIPVIVFSIPVILSNFYQLLFYIDKNNHYHRGPYFWVMALLCYLYLMHTMVSINIRHKKVKNSNFLPILVFTFPPFIGGLIQFAFYGVSLVWICMTVSILILFINLQNDQLYKDYLTGLFNRRQLDYYLSELTQKNKTDYQIAGIMIDLNSFKGINDQYGHHIGDEALKHTAGLLKKTFGKNAFIARYGGDEFVVVMEVSKIAELDEAIAKLKINISKFNELKTVPYLINVSLGADFYDTGSGMSSYEFLKHIDDLMYADKEKYRKS